MKLMWQETNTRPIHMTAMLSKPRRKRKAFWFNHERLSGTYVHNVLALLLPTKTKVRRILPSYIHLLRTIHNGKVRNAVCVTGGNSGIYITVKIYFAVRQRLRFHFDLWAKQDQWRHDQFGFPIDNTKHVESEGPIVKSNQALLDLPDLAVTVDRLE